MAVMAPEGSAAFAVYFNINRLKAVELSHRYKQSVISWGVLPSDIGALYLA